MIQIIGVTLPKIKKIKYALCQIYGIGQKRSQQILKEAKIDDKKKIMELSYKNLIKIKQIIEKNYKVEKLLKHQLKLKLNHLQTIKCLRGRRHKLKLPVRGQRTRTNAQTTRKKIIL